MLGDLGPVQRLAQHVLGCLSKQIKGVRALKDDGGCFHVLPQAAVAPIVGNGLKAFRMFPDLRCAAQDFKALHHLHISRPLTCFNAALLDK